MSIRYYLLLLAGVISTVVILGSFFIDNVILIENLQKARQEALSVFNALFEEKRENTQRFTAGLIAKNMAQVNATLEAISKFDPLTDWFAATEENKKKGTWNNAANLIQQEEWINFLQNTTDSKLLSLIVPQNGPFFEVEVLPIQEGIAWVYIKGSPAYENPFLGIQVPIKTSDLGTEEIGTFLTSGILPTTYLLYETNRFKKLKFLTDKPETFLLDQTPFAGGIEIDANALAAHLSKALAFLQNPSTVIPPPIESSFPLVPDEGKIKNFSEKLEDSFQERISYGNELFLIWQATLLKEMGIFGQMGNEENWPDVMTFSSGKESSQAFFIKPVLQFSKPLFDDAAFFAKNPPKKVEDFVSSGAAVVKSPHENQAFLTNTAKIVFKEGGKKEESYLTIGFDVSPMLKNFVLSSQFYGCIVSGGEVIVNIAPPGKVEIPSEVLGPLFSAQQNVPYGLVDIAGVSYHFSGTQPDPNLDFHVIIFDPKQEGFSIIYEFQSRVKKIVKTVARDRRILEIVTLVVLWLLLLDVSRKITNPILALSSALKHVKRGNWDQIQIPKIAFKKKNEIKQLFDSFADMVEGMKEKEKITGILNKVVSEEIAKEILKKDVKLGGEERVVTMLFADIRGFTKLTQNMPPHEVIGFLNKCMTKLSNAVEENKGVIDKYMGDGLMALYGAPIAYEESPLHAVISALEMINTLKQWNVERIRNNLSPIYVGIGVHTGPVFAGNMGAQNRLNYTVIGSNVNLASRLCSAAGPEELLITEDTYHQPAIRDSVEVEDKGLMAFKGFDEKKQVFKVLRLKTKEVGKLLMKEEGKS